MLQRLPERPVPRSLPPRPAYGAKPVGALVPAVTRQAFQRFGFSTASLLTEWSRIIGPDLARVAVPDRVKWPRRREREQDEDDTALSREGATIVLRVDGPRAVEVQYKSQLIKDRINAYFGYAAISTVRVMQAPLTASRCEDHQPTRCREHRSTPGSTPKPDLSEIAQPDLRHALTRLHAAVTGHVPRRNVVG